MVNLFVVLSFALGQAVDVKAICARGVSTQALKLWIISLFAQQ